MEKAMKKNTNIDDTTAGTVVKEAMSRLWYIARHNTEWSAKVEQDILEELMVLGLYFDLDIITVATPYGKFTPTALVAETVGLTINFITPEEFVEKLQDSFSEIVAFKLSDFDNNVAEIRKEALLHYIIFLLDDEAEWSENLQGRLVQELKCIDSIYELMLKGVTVEIIPKGKVSLSFLTQGPPKFGKLWPSPKDFREALGEAFNEVFSK